MARTRTPAAKRKALKKLPLLTREGLLGAKDIVEDEFEVPEWGGSVKIKVLSKGDQLWVRDNSRDADGLVDEDRVELLILVKGIITPQLEVADAEALKEKSAYVIERVSDRILSFSSTTRKAATSAADVEAAERGFLEGGPE